jgi:hypothetical protein
MEEDIAILMADLSGYRTFSDPSAFTFNQKENTALKISAKKKKCFS